MSCVSGSQRRSQGHIRDETARFSGSACSPRVAVYANVRSVAYMTATTVVIPRRELVTLLAYLRTDSHAQAAHALGISESTSRQRVSLLMRRVGARNAAQAVWALKRELEGELGLTQPSVPAVARIPPSDTASGHSKV